MTWSGDIKPTVRKRSKVDILSKRMAPRGREVRGELKKVLRGEALPQGPAPYPYLHTV